MQPLMTFKNKKVLGLILTLENTFLKNPKETKVTYMVFLVLKGIGGYATLISITINTFLKLQTGTISFIKSSLI